MKKRARKMFPGQRDDEHVIFMLRPHWFIFLRQILQLVVFNLIPILIFFFLYYVIGWGLPTEGALYVGLVMLAGLYYLGAWLAYFHSFADYHLDLWILTDQRIVDIEQKGLFDRVISELNVIKVQDVTSEVHGHLQTFFDYGNVYIQTSAETQRFVFQNVPRPEDVTRLVIRASDAASKRHAQQTGHEPDTT
jgi:hypothetical protein